jgi:hypothetical protein
LIGHGREHEHRRRHRRKRHEAGTWAVTGEGREGGKEGRKGKGWNGT